MTRLRLAFTTMAMLAAGISLSCVANATPPTFDVQGYSTCTATTAPGPDEDFDGVVTSCCVEHAGIPTPSAYGMACVATPPEVVPTDYRPTIVLPTRPQATDDAGLLQGDVDADGNPDLPLEPNVVGDPFAAGGPR